jgi:hypothetical protein
MSKEIIETMINTTALTLTSYGVVLLTTNKDYFGFLIILFGMVLEFCKYFGRKKKIW